MSEEPYKDPPRELTSVLAGLEKRTLVWLAHRTPRWVNSDHLTALGLVGMIMVGVSYVLARWTPLALLLATFWLFVNWFGDSLDGTLARVRNCQRPRYGYYVDHVADVVGQTALVGGMGLSGYMSPMVALGLLVAFLMLSNEVYLATHVRARFKITFWKVGPTELRLIIAIGNVAAVFHPYTTIAGPRLLLFDVGGAVAIVGLVATFAASAIGNTRALYREEPLPGARAEGMVARTPGDVCRVDASDRG
jgi:archaetidylinositol phosphate synthase